MSVPTTKVYIALNLLYSDSYFILNDTTQGVLNSVYTLGGDIYIDVTDYVASVSVDRGKSRELDRYTAGHASVTLHNESRVFDPFNVDSPYYTQILPRKGIIIETNGERVFTGFIDDWDLTYDISGKSFASVSAVDGFLLLSAAELDSFTTTSQLSSARVTAVLDRLEVNWPNADRSIETGLTTLQADTVQENTNALQYLQLVETTENGKLFIDRSGLLTFKNRAIIPPDVFTTVFSDELTGDIARTNLIPNPSFETNTTGWGGANITISQSTTFAKYGVDSLKGVVTTTGTNRYIDKGETDVFITTGLDYTASIWVYLPLTNTANITLGLWAYGWNATGYGGANVLETKLVTRGTWTRLSGSFNSINGTTGEATKVLLRVINQSSWAAGQEIYLDGALLEQTNFLNDYFDGSFYGAQWTGTANASTSEIPPTSYIPYTNIGVVYGSENLYNRVTITRAGGTPQVADSTASQTSYGIAAYSLDGLLLNSDTDSSNLANYLISLYDQPELRIDELTVNLHDKSDAAVANLIDLEIGDLVQVTFTPNQTGAQITQYLVINGIKNNIGIDRHQMTFQFASINQFNFILDSARYGVLNTGILAY